MNKLIASLCGAKTKMNSRILYKLLHNAAVKGIYLRSQKLYKIIVIGVVFKTLLLLAQLELVVSS